MSRPFDSQKKQRTDGAPSHYGHLAIIASPQGRPQGDLHGRCQGICRRHLLEEPAAGALGAVRGRLRRPRFVLALVPTYEDTPRLDVAACCMERARGPTKTMRIYGLPARRAALVAGRAVPARQP